MFIVFLFFSGYPQIFQHIPQRTTRSFEESHSLALPSDPYSCLFRQNCKCIMYSLDVIALHCIHCVTHCRSSKCIVFKAVSLRVTGLLVKSLNPTEFLTYMVHHESYLSVNFMLPCVNDFINLARNAATALHHAKCFHNTVSFCLSICLFVCE